MKTKKILTAVAALVLSAAVGASAASGGELGPLYDAGMALLFDTTNVTVSVNADFFLDGERIKTVKAICRQDDYDSYLDYRLFTPRDAEFDGEPQPDDRETGYTIVANRAYTDPQTGSVSVNLSRMEVIHPGVYYPGTDAGCNTLVRPSAQLDALAALAGLVVRQTEPLLPSGAVTAEESALGRTVHVRLTRDGAGDLADSVFTLCAQAFISRVIKREDFDALPVREYYGSASTIVEELLYTTAGYSLKGADVTLTADENGLLRAVSGTVSVGLTPHAQAGQYQGLLAPARPHTVDVTFEMTVSDYGETHVAPFLPEDYGVRGYWEE